MLIIDHLFLHIHILFIGQEYSPILSYMREEVDLNYLIIYTYSFKILHSDWLVYIVVIRDVML